jgi:predicted metalloprotease
MKTAQQRYKQEQFLRDQRKAEEAVAAAERVRRDRMSRGKDPYCSDDASDESEQHGSSASTSKYRLGG